MVFVVPVGNQVEASIADVKVEQAGVGHKYVVRWSFTGQLPSGGDVLDGWDSVSKRGRQFPASWLANCLGSCNSEAQMMQHSAWRR